MTKRIIPILVLAAVLIMGFAVLGTVSFATENTAASNLSTTQSTVTTGTVKAPSLNVRESAKADSEVICKLSNGTKVTIVGKGTGWYKIDINGTYGWVNSQYIVNLKKETIAVSDSDDSNSADTAGNVASADNTVSIVSGTQEVSRGDYISRQPIADETEDVALSEEDKARIELGKAVVASAEVYERAKIPYVYGTTGPNSFDCSGLLITVFGENGVSVPRSSKGYMLVGKAVKLQDAQIGDVICFSHNGYDVGHVGIYKGNGYFIHCSTSQGVTTTSIENSYWKPRIFAVRRVL